MSVLGRTRVIFTAIILIVHSLLHQPFLGWANRVEPVIGGLPFLLVYLWVVYIILLLVLLIGVRAIERAGD